MSAGGKMPGAKLTPAERRMDGLADDVAESLAAPARFGIKPVGAKRRRPIGRSASISPVVEALFTAIEAAHPNVTDLARRAGIPKETIYRWAQGHTPRLMDLAAVAEVVGLRVELVPVASRA